MNIFNLDLKRYVGELMPPFLRDPVFFGFLIAFIAPVIDLYDNFIQNRESNIIKLKFNYQTCSVEYRLNDVFDPVLRRIKIAKAVTYKGVFLYTKAETDPTNPNYYGDDPNNKIKWLHGDEKPIYLRTKAELYSQYDFIVLIPVGVEISNIKLRAEIDFYILQSKQYKIETF